MRQDQTRRRGSLPFPTFAWGIALCAALLVVLLLGVSARSWAQEAIAQEEPTPASVQEEVTPSNGPSSRSPFG